MYQPDQRGVYEKNYYESFYFSLPLLVLPQWVFWKSLCVRIDVFQLIRVPLLFSLSEEKKKQEI